MVARKRGRQEMEENGVEEVVASEPTMLQKIRNMWEFASLMQFLFLFGKAVKIEDVDVDVSTTLHIGPCRRVLLLTRDE